MSVSGAAAAAAGARPGLDTSGQLFPVRPGYYFAGSPGGAQSSAALGNGTLRVAPWLVGESVPIDRLFADIVAAGDALAVVRLVVYTATDRGLPDALLTEGTIAADTAGVKEATVSATLPRGLVYVGAVVQANVTMPNVRTNRHEGVTWSGHSTALPAAAATMTSYTQTGVTGSAPAAWGGVYDAAWGQPRVGVRVAA